MDCSSYSDIDNILIICLLLLPSLMLCFCFVFAGSRTYVAVSRSGLECSIYVNGLLSGHSTAAASVVYRNSDLVFGANHLNNSDYFSGSMDHVAIYFPPRRYLPPGETPPPPPLPVTKVIVVAVTITV